MDGLICLLQSDKIVERLLAADKIHFELWTAGSFWIIVTLIHTVHSSIALQHLAGSGLAVTFDVLIKAEKGTYCQMCSRVCRMNTASSCWSKANGPFLS